MRFLMTVHEHPEATPKPGDREAFLIDGCERCREYVDELGLPFDPMRWRAFWNKMVDVEFDNRSGWASEYDKELGRRLYYVALGLQRATGADPHVVAVPWSYVPYPIIETPADP